MAVCFGEVSKEATSFSYPTRELKLVSTLVLKPVHRCVQEEASNPMVGRSQGLFELCREIYR